MNLKANVGVINYRILLRNLPIHLQKRWKGRNSMLKKKNAPSSIDKALTHFDDFYGKIFNKTWPSMRLALLSTQKYIAVVNNYSDTDRISSFLESLGGIDLRRLIEIQSEKVHTNRIHSRQNTSNDISRKIQKFGDEKKELEISSLYAKSEDPGYISASSIPDTFASEDRLIEPSLGMSSAALSQYVPTTGLTGMESWIPESQHYNYYESGEDHPTIVVQKDLEFPKNLHAYTFELGNVDRFPACGKGSTGVSDYYLLNGGSLLPVIALDLAPGDRLLDMCAAPGGKSLLSLQTLLTSSVVLNDLSMSRVNRMDRLMKEFFYDYEKKVKNKEITLYCKDGRSIDLDNFFNKIIVDVPCTTDRLSVMEEDNNIFKSGRTKERIQMPELQSQLLINALKLVKVGGVVVYSTCSLSPTQNDGVVALALRTIAQQTDNEYVVVDMTEALQSLEIIYKFGNKLGLKCGHIVIPYLPANFGPTYFCKLIRIK